ncbi:hypothetical protein L210DRAFT_3646226 [Boletus edulis BED1]|uniref:Uncharacterized protein n=1 Tax=Boletus edulis BED1 TaxID=1328754 RepID=A0AAD4BTI7_BOLED|nr:hypothetical protein L210DRAFT_3646226 [Boletus edulis BED1]
MSSSSASKHSINVTNSPIQVTLEAECLHLQEEKEAKKEEQKKNGIKFFPFADVPPPSTIPITQSPLTLCKLCKGEYISLYFFTNKGLTDAQSLSHSINEDAFALLPDEQGLHSFVPITTAKAKQSIIENCDLTWTQIDEATHHMIQAMKEAEWPEEHIQALFGFWMNLGMHDWRHDVDESAHQALIIYQATYHRCWQDTLGTTSSFNLKHIDQEALMRIKVKIIDQKYQATEKWAQEVMDKLITTITQLQSNPSSSAASALQHHPSSYNRAPSFSKRPASLPSEATQLLHKWNKSFRAPKEPLLVRTTPYPHVLSVLALTPTSYQLSNAPMLVLKSTNDSASNSNAERAARKNMFTHTSAQDVLPPLALSIAFMHRSAQVQTPYKPDIWEHFIQIANLSQHFDDIPNRLRYSFIVDCPRISHLQSPSNPPSVNMYLDQSYTALTGPSKS